MIGSYANDGKGEEGINLFEKMIKETNLIPDEVTFICLLTGCSHLGLVDKAQHYFELMKEYKIPPNIYHYTCMIDVLSRKGKLDEAEKYLNNLKLQNIKVNVKKFNSFFF